MRFLRTGGTLKRTGRRIVMGAIVAVMAGTIGSPPVRAGAAAPAGWVNTGPPGAILEDLAVSPADPSRLYAVSGAHLYRSRDGGRSWKPTPVTPSFEPNLALSWGDPDLVYAADRVKIVKSVDGGVTWTNVTNGLPGSAVHMVVAPDDDATVYAGLNSYPSAMYKTSDGGATWSQASNGFSIGATIEALAIDPVSPLVVLAGTSGGLYRTTDGAASWALTGSGLPTKGFDHLVVDPHDHLRLFATVDRHVYRSLDGGATWTKSDTGLGNAPTSGLAVSPTAPGTVYTATAPGWPTDPEGPSGVFRSTDGGSTWTQTTDVVGASTLVADPTGTLLAIGDPLGVLRSVDGGLNWTQGSRGMFETGISAVAVDPTDASVGYVSTGGKGGVFKTVDGGRTWTQSGQGLSQTVVSLAVAPSDPMVLYAGMANYDWYGYYGKVGVSRSVDGGATWTPFNAGIDDVQIDALAVDPTDPNVVFAAGEYFCDECNDGGVWKSVDGGSSWLSLPGLEAAAFPAIAMSPSNPNVLYAAASKYGTVYRTLDGGVTWTRVNSGLGSALIADLAVDAADPYLVYAVDARLYRTTDGGAHWTKGGPQTPQRAYTVEADPAVPGSVCAGESSGRVSCSVDNGLTWTKIPGIRGAAVELAVGPGKVLYVGTGSHGAAVYHR